MVHSLATKQLYGYLEEDTDVIDGLMVVWEGSSRAESVSLGQREPSPKVRCGLSQTV